MGSCVFDTSFGWCGLVGTARGVRRVFLPERSRRRVEKHVREAAGSRPGGDERLDALARDICDYFDGEREVFAAELDLTGYPPFYVRVWEQVVCVPYGTTVTYGEIARRCGSPNAARAVGGAMRRNPLPILVPCHRILGSDGGLCGFSATGGLRLKQWMLALEGGRETFSHPFP
jgi:methylated-DNA-[protein]-cysteine S-methyltransferase